MEESVDSVRTLHHDHVTPLLNHFQEGKQEDLLINNTGGYHNIKIQYLICNIA